MDGLDGLCHAVRWHRRSRPETGVCPFGRALKPGETRHLVAILNQMTGKDWQPWFERHVYGAETPELR